ncbi:MAG: hypothetical protein GY742_21195 [Hyphomicrobiales bacterium]|nr:hypothetical protein [Hyphomicrobiales bacterium]
MKTITLPIVAHRIFSKKYASEIVWEDPPKTFFERKWWEEWAAGMNNPPKWRDTSDEKPRSQGEPSIRLDKDHGTVRSIDEIRDIFDGSRRSRSSNGNSVNRIWKAAGIKFRLIAIVDEGLPLVRSIGIDHESVIDVASHLNTPKMVNVYFFQNITGARGVGGWSPDPLQEMLRLVPFAAGEDTDSWDGTVIVMAHELGHLLNLSHMSDSENLMYPSAWDSATLIPMQIMIARNQARYYRQPLPSLFVHKWFRDHFIDVEEPPFRRDALREGPLVLGQPVPRPGDPVTQLEYVMDSAPVFGYGLPRAGDYQMYKNLALDDLPLSGKKKRRGKSPGKDGLKVQKHALALLNSLEIDSMVVAQLAGLPDATKTLSGIAAGTVKATAKQRQNAVYALGRIGDPKASDALLNVLDTTDMSMRIAALVALRALGPDTQIRKRLWQFVKKKDVERVEADHARLVLGQKVSAFSNGPRHGAEVNKGTYLAPGP